MATKTISAWSHSALGVFESCPQRSKFAKIDRIPEPERPAPVKGGEHANDRGSRVHDHAEDFVRGKVQSQCMEMEAFHDEFIEMRNLFKKGVVVLEDMWCFNDGWTAVGPKDYENIWVRIKLDAMVFLSKVEGVVIDYKTGKRYGNEIKHAEQGQLYTLAAFLRYPELEKVTCEFWYLDQNEISSMTYTRNQAMRFLQRFNDRGLAMTTETLFKAKPNRNSCMFCPYGPEEHSNKWVNKSGHCKDGV